MHIYRQVLSNFDTMLQASNSTGLEKNRELCMVMFLKLEEESGAQWIVGKGNRASNSDVLHDGIII